MITTIASGAINLVTWTFFSMLISFFVLSETGGQRSKMIQVNIPGFEADFNRIRVELGHIWNAFLRGQLLIVFLAFLIYLILLGGLGINFFFGSGLDGRARPVHPMDRTIDLLRNLRPGGVFSDHPILSACSPCYTRRLL